jgi:hypothetical protein
MRFLLPLLLLCSSCFGAEERVLKLPEDGDKWYVSVVGNTDEIQPIVAQFDTGRLHELKKQVHFIPCTPNDPMYSRYGVTKTPTVRVQDALGRIVFEASRNVPQGDALYEAIATAAERHRLLPLRQRRQQPQPQPQPQPKPVPPLLDMEPDPLDDGGEPDVEPGGPNLPDAPVLPLCVLILIIGVATGIRKARLSATK